MDIIVEMLLKAAEFVEKHDIIADIGRELFDHGYASSRSAQFRRQPARKPRLRKSSWSQTTGGRSLHNELEKNRRANLRHCLERLRDTIPVGGASTKNTTLQLLKRAKQYIMSLEQEQRRCLEMKADLLEQQKQLYEHLQVKERIDSHQHRLLRSALAQQTYDDVIPADDTASSSASMSDNEYVDIMGSASESDDYTR